MPAKILLTLMLTVFPFTILFADIIITIDDMILNGKILKEDKKTVKFGNYHGVFIIDRDKIKEIYRTGSYEDDIKILSGKGRTVNRDEVKTNYDSGVKKIEEQKIPEDENESTKTSAGPHFAVSPWIIFNLGQCGDVLPYSCGVFLTADFPVNDSGFAKMIYISYMTIDAGYYYSAKGERGVTGYRASAGPQWVFPVINDPIQMEYTVSAMLGAGWYNVRGLEEEAAAVKWNVSVNTGIIFTFSSITVSPVIKMDYIYDSKAAIYGIGAALSIGYRF